MWFGDLVTMKWWDDLWLNESFAEWACYHAAVENTEFTEAWTGFTNARKNWALRQDQLPSTHPIAADNYDLHAVEVNFDGITYAKGASVLKQLVAWVGLESFMVGLRQYFKDHAYANSEFVDLLTALEKASGRELDAWAKEWLQTSGVNTLSPEFELADDGTFASFGVRQSAAGDNATLRRHRLGIGLYDEVGGRLVRRRNVETDIEGDLTAIDELVGEKQPDLLLLNDGDLTYAKIRLDERSLATVVGGLRQLDDSLARALCWGAAWDMTRDAEMTASDFVTLVLANIATETDAFGVRAIPNYAAAAVNIYSHRSRRAELRARWESGVRELLLAAEPGSDHQLTFARAYAAAARSDQAVADLTGLLDGSLVIEGLDIDTDLRWALVIGLARAGAADEARIDEELERDRTISGQEYAAAARASRPDADAKARAWTDLVDEPRHPQRDPPLDRGQLHAARPGGPARAVRREVPRGGRRHLGASRHPHGLQHPRGCLPDPDGEPRPGRAAGPLARRVARQPGRQALRARGTRRRGPGPGGPGEGRPRLTPSRRKQTREIAPSRRKQTPGTRRVVTCRLGGSGQTSAWRVRGARDCMASMLIPRRRPRTRSPEANSVRISSTARATSWSVSTRRTSLPVTISSSRAAGSTMTRTLREGAESEACSRSAKARASPSAAPTNTENSNLDTCSAARIV